MIDDHGQPSAIFNWRERTIREIDELIGLCKGMLADGIVNQEEALFLQQWLRANRDSRDTWPCCVLLPRIDSMLADGTLSDSEERELLSLLIGISGGNPSGLNAHSLSAGLPLDEPAPDVLFPQNTFCFTGKMLCGTRKWCETRVIERGGLVSETVTKALSYLVIGTVGSRDWLHSTYGRKIERAVEYRDGGDGLKIIAEEHFANSLD